MSAGSGGVGYDGYRLPLAQRPFDGESLLGLLVRNTGVHGYPNPRSLLLPVGLRDVPLATLGASVLAERDAEALACLLGVDRETLNRLHHGSALPPKLNMLGHTVGPEFVSTTHRRICPLCVRDSAHHRALWNSTLFTACPEHGCLLLNRCPTCDRLLTWSAGKVGACSTLGCSRDLTEVTTQTLTPASLVGVRALADIVLGRGSLPSPVSSVDSLMRLTLKLGLVAQDRKIAKGVLKFAENEPAAMAEAVSAGWHALDDWPHGYHRFLAGLRQDASRRRGRYGVVKEFGLLPSLFERTQDDPDVRRLHQDFALFTADQADLATRSRAVRGARGAAGQSYITATEGKARLHVPYERLRELADRHGLWSVLPDGKGAPGLLDADKLSAFAEKLDGVLTKKDAADLLVVPKKVFWKIEDAGLLPLVPEADRLVGECMYRRQDVEDLLARLEATAGPQVSPKTRKKLVTVDYLARGGADMSVILSAVVEGRLRPRSIDDRARGVRRLLFEKQWVYDALGTGGDSMSVDQAAKVRIPRQSSRRFRSIPAGDSDGSQPLIPMHSSHP